MPRNSICAWIRALGSRGSWFRSRSLAIFSCLSAEFEGACTGEGMRNETLAVGLLLTVVGYSCAPTAQEGKTREQLIALLGSSDRVTRIEAASMLGDHFCPGTPPPLQPQILRYFLPTAAPVIVPLLSDPRPGTRSAAAYALERCGDGSASVIAALEKALLDPDKVVRVDAALAISHLECPKGQGARVLSHLIDGIKDRHRVDVVALWLRQLGPAAEPAVPALVDALSSTDVDTRLCVPLALGSIGKGARPALTRLREILENDPEPTVRENAKQAIQDILGAVDGQRVGTMAAKGCR